MPALFSIFVFLFSALFLSAKALPAKAQSPSELSTPNSIPKAPTTPNLDELFARLARAEDGDEAAGIANLIERRWYRSESDTAALLMTRASQAIDGKDYPLAIELLDRILVLQPEWAAAWYRRATVFYLLDDPVDAMADLHRVLRYEPRHYGAWTGLGHLYMSADDNARALEAFRRALKIYPKLPQVDAVVERLAPRVDGLEL